MPAELATVLRFTQFPVTGHTLNPLATLSCLPREATCRVTSNRRKSRRTAGGFNLQVLSVFYIQWTQSVQMLTKFDIS